MRLGIILLLLLPSCATVEVLDGLCYNDRQGSHLCEPENSWNKCESWKAVDAEAWSNCMMIYA